MSLITPGRRRSFQGRVLAWYAGHARDLPWRKTRDPYAILVSEILSHQTQIGRVVPVYQELLDRYPTVDSLSRARLQAVKAITDPLGYKVRGAWLHAAALQVADHGFPTTVDGLRMLPGVGRYTAGALMSFAHRQDAAAVDTNVARVLSRHFARSIAGRDVWAVAATLIPRGQGHRFNQALMDIGAVFCRARAPRCGGCPIRRSCDFRRVASGSSGAGRRSRPGDR